ncbi:MAG: phage holin family protein, partial [Bacteroidetes bacterium]
MDPLRPPGFSASTPDSPVENPDGRTKIDRITRHTRDLVQDVRNWVDLKLKLTRLEVQEQVDEALHQARIGAALAFVGFLAVQFLLVTLALLIGDALGHAKWGFLILTVLLVAVLIVLRYALKPNVELFRFNKTTRKVEVPAHRLKEVAPPEPTD